MCVIIDNNTSSLVFSDPPDPDFKPVFDWLFESKQTGMMVIGGKLTEELTYQNGRRRATAGIIARLLQAGRVYVVPNNTLKQEELQMHGFNLQCESDDEHIIILARASGARTLCSNDATLHRDFANPQLVSQPQGKIYTNLGRNNIRRKPQTHVLTHRDQNCPWNKVR